MKKVPNSRVFLIVLAAMFALPAGSVLANPSAPAPRYRVLLCRGTVGGSATAQTAVTQLSYPNPRAAGLVAYYLSILEVPGLTVTWNTPGGTRIQVPEWNPNPKERIVRAAFQYSAVGIYPATCTLTYDCPGGGTATRDINLQIKVIPGSGSGFPQVARAFPGAGEKPGGRQ